jgi:hypothetical protein
MSSLPSALAQTCTHLDVQKRRSTWLKEPAFSPTSAAALISRRLAAPNCRGRRRHCAYVQSTLSWQLLPCRWTICPCSITRLAAITCCAWAIFCEASTGRIAERNLCGGIARRRRRGSLAIEERTISCRDFYSSFFIVRRQNVVWNIIKNN